MGLVDDHLQKQWPWDVAADVDTVGARAEGRRSRRRQMLRWGLNGFVSSLVYRGVLWCAVLCWGLAWLVWLNWDGTRRDRMSGWGDWDL